MQSHTHTEMEDESFTSSKYLVTVKDKANPNTILSTHSFASAYDAINFVMQQEANESVTCKLSKKLDESQNNPTLLEG